MNRTLQSLQDNEGYRSLMQVSNDVFEDIDHKKTPELLWFNLETLPNTSDSPVDRVYEEDWISWIYNLLHNLDQLADMLRHEIDRNAWLNTYLIVAGMCQITEDFLHPDPYLLSRSVKYLNRLPRPLGGSLAGIVRFISRTSTSIFTSRKEAKEVARWQRRLLEYSCELAEMLVYSKTQDKATAESLAAKGERLIATIERFPGILRQNVMRLPSCFRSFDQRYEDLELMMRKFSQAYPDRSEKILLVGIRTSGSYLVPLYAAILKARGYQDVSIITVRPDRDFNAREKEALRRLKKEGGLALLCDDPPITGASIMKAAWQLEKRGLSQQKIVLILQIYGKAEGLPQGLQRYPSILIPWEEWNIHQQLAPEKIEKVLSKIYGAPVQVSRIAHSALVDREGTREHVRALYVGTLVEPKREPNASISFLVKGAGLGYFGEHALAIAQKLPKFASANIVLFDGLLYQELPPNSEQFLEAELPDRQNWIDLFADYVLERNRKFPVLEDISLRLNNRNAVWEVASTIISQVFGRGWLVVRIPLIDPIIKRLLRASHPSVDDGDMSMHNWLLRHDPDAPLLKLDPDERDFSHADLYCFDPVYDLACQSLELDPENPPPELRHSFELLSAERVSPERWMLYNLVHLWDLGRQNVRSKNRIAKDMARALQRYFAEIYFRDLTISTNGPYCAIDIDGVLETNLRGFPALSPKGALSLRALAAHGYRIVLASGRSLKETKDRCKVYPIVGAVAEYGAVVYNHITGQTKSLLSESDRAVLEKLCARIIEIPGVILDPDYQYAIRAYRYENDGQRVGLNKEELSTLLSGDAEISHLIQAIPGEAQTDFMVSRINKGIGLMAFLELSVANSDEERKILQESKPYEFAVGDSAADLPMFAVAKKAFAPAHARSETVQAGIKVMNRPYQSGLAQAVAHVLNHHPGKCPRCLPLPQTDETKLMQEILAAQENGITGMAGQILKLAFAERRWLHGGAR